MLRRAQVVQRRKVCVTIAAGDVGVEGHLVGGEERSEAHADGTHFLVVPVRRLSRGSRTVPLTVPHHIVLIMRDARLVQVQHQSVIGHNFLV